MTEPGHHTRSEILSQPDSWRAALDVIQSQSDLLIQFFQAGRYDLILFTGCGSTYYLAIAAAATLQELANIPARGVPASEIWLYPRSAYPTNQKTLLIAVSRSGETTETLRACESFRDRGGDVLTLSCYPGRVLTQVGQVNMVFPSGQEESIAQTRAFTTLYLATVALAALWSDRADLFDELNRLPDLAQALISNAKHQILTKSLAHDPTIDRFYFLGSGARYGLACELSLKMKEMSLSHSEPFHFMEFRHGPKSMVTANTLIVGLVSESNCTPEVAVLNDLRAMGARVLSIGEGEADVAFSSGLAEAVRGGLYLPAGQLLGFERSLHNGLNPDRPNNLDAVVKL